MTAAACSRTVGSSQAAADRDSQSLPMQSAPPDNPEPPAPPTPTPTGDGNTVADPNTAGQAFFGPSRCTAAAVQLCDGFEDTPPGAPPSTTLWRVETTGSGSSVAVESGRAARGNGAVHVHTASNGFAQAVLRNETFFPVAGNSFFGRAFVYFASAGALPQAHWTLFEGGGRLPGQSSDTWVRYGGQFTHLMANYFGDDQYQHAADNVDGKWVREVKMPANRWACFEWQFVATGNVMRLWLDGQEVPQLTVNNISSQCCPTQPWTMPAFSSIRLGWQVYQAEPGVTGFDMWLDEVALDRQRIGCSR